MIVIDTDSYFLYTTIVTILNGSNYKPSASSMKLFSSANEIESALISIYFGHETDLSIFIYKYVL